MDMDMDTDMDTAVDMNIDPVLLKTSFKDSHDGYRMSIKVYSDIRHNVRLCAFQSDI
jgi:hypothetical protein